MKKLLVIGAGLLQSFLIHKARELGYYVIAIDKNPISIGFPLANESKVIDIVDKEACLQFAASKRIDGVLTAATDYGVLTASYIAAKLGLPGLNFDAATLIKNKYLIRKTLVKHKIDSIKQFIEIDNVNEIPIINNTLIYPVIVKPSDGSGSKAVSKVTNVYELEIAVEAAIKASLTKKAIIEDFIEGVEYGVESIVLNGEVYVLGILDKHMTSPPIYAELGHSLPSGLENEVPIIETVASAIKALNINFGAVNMDIIVNNENQITIIDIGARMGGNLIGSHLIPNYTGFDYMKCLIESALSHICEHPDKFIRTPVATKILALSPGNVSCLPNFKAIEDQFDVVIFYNLIEGSKIKEYKNNLDGCGYVFAVGTEKEDCLNRVLLAKEAIDIGITRS
jgi:biotin carboxylase